ncbi:MAG: hypothetical protein ACYC3I_15660 [Gemmataceae bacterium]
MTPTLAFVGWIRLPGQLWQPVVSAETEDEAWRLLRQHVDRLNAKMIDSYIGPADVDPRGRRVAGSTQKRLFT